MIKRVEVGEIKVGDVVVGSGERFTVIKRSHGIIPRHPILFVTDVAGKVVEHDTAFQDTIEVEVADEQL